MIKIGLTGGIGSGKSTVGSLFKRYGIAIIDADPIAKSIIDRNGSGYKRVIDLFGPSIVNPDLSINKKVIKNIIFENDQIRTKLEKIVHPIVEDTIREELKKLKGPYCIIVAPLLFESGLDKMMDRILVIDTKIENQIQRGSNRDGLSTEIINKIIATQISQKERLERADDIISNNGDKDHLQKEVAHYHQKYLSIAEKAVSQNASNLP